MKYSYDIFFSLAFITNTYASQIKIFMTWHCGTTFVHRGRQTQELMKVPWSCSKCKIKIFPALLGVRCRCKEASCCRHQVGDNNLWGLLVLNAGHCLYQSKLFIEWLSLLSRSCAAPSRTTATSTWWWSSWAEATWSHSPWTTTYQRSGLASTQRRWCWRWTPSTPWASSIVTSNPTTCCWTRMDTSNWQISARAWRWTR